MNFFKEAHSAFDFAKYYPLLIKAIADNDTTTPGYIYEEIIKISFLTHQHRIHLVDFLLSRLTNLGWAGKQKIIRILLQLCKKGHFEIRLILRQRDGDLRKAASLGGPPDPVLANTPQLFFNSAIQELLSYIFDPNVMKLDEEISQKGGKEPEVAGSAVGYGSSGTNQGKYDGFGNSPINKQENFVDQFVEFVGKVVPSEAHKREALEGFLKTEKGNYQPFILSPNIPLPPSVSSSITYNQQQSSIPPMYTSVLSPRNKGHVAGKVGGGWDSDEDEEEETLTAKLASISYILPVQGFEKKPQNENYIKTLLDEHSSWPVDYETFVSKCKECTIYNPFELLSDVSKEIKLNKTEMQLAEEDTNEKSPKKVDNKSSKAAHNLLILLLFIEYCLNEDLLSVNLLSTHLLSLLNEISLQKCAPKSVRMKSKKINLLLKSLSSYS